MTLGRCSTNGASGTLVEEQYGASASATERTAYSCSSRSLRGAGQLRRPGRVARVVAGAADRAGQHARGDQAALAPHEQLGGGAEEPVDVEGPAHRVALGEPAQRPADVDRLVGGRHEVAREHDLLEVALADAAYAVGHHASPTRRRHRAVGEGHLVAVRRRASGSGSRSGSGASSSWPITVTHARPPRRADDDRGHDQHAATGVVGEGEAARGRSSPVPGTPTSSRTTAAAVVARHQSAASANRSAPDVRHSAATPQATRPSPRRTQASALARRAAGRAAARGRRWARPRRCGRPAGRQARPRSGWSRRRRYAATRVTPAGARRVPDRARRT